MTGSLEGLGAELRKAAKTTLEIWSTQNYLAAKKEVERMEEVAQELKDFENLEWLPAALVAQDRQRIKQELNAFIDELIGDADLCAPTNTMTVAVANNLEKLREKLEEAFK